MLDNRPGQIYDWFEPRGFPHVPADMAQLEDQDAAELEQRLDDWRVAKARLLAALACALIGAAILAGVVIVTGALAAASAEQTFIEEPIAP